MPGKVEAPILVAEKEVVCHAAVADDSDQSDGDDSDEDIDDATASEAIAIRKQINEFLVDQKDICWERKKLVKDPFHKPPV